MNKIALLVAAAAALFATNVAAQQDIGKNAKVTLVFDQQLPNVPGKSLRVVLVEYGPGGGSPSHRHPSSAFIYARVLEGAIRSKVNDASERTYQAGESWTELPGDHHQVSQNAKLIAARVPAHGDEIFLGAVGAFAMDSYAARAWGGQPIAPRRLQFSAGPRLPEPHERSCSRGF